MDKITEVALRMLDKYGITGQNNAQWWAYQYVSQFDRQKHQGHLDIWIKVAFRITELSRVRFRSWERGV